MSTALSASQQQSTIPSSVDQEPDWKRQLAERLDAYRSKHPETNPPAPSTSSTLTDSRASRIARSVASRYAAVPTYSELMAAAQAQAEAQAERERVAHEAHLVQQKKMMQERAAQEQFAALEAQRAASISNDNSSSQPAATQPGTPVMPQFAARTQQMHVHQTAPEPEPTLEDLWASALVEPRSVLPSKLIEFPRELVSSRRARPRLPENPDQTQRPEVQQPDSAQLRIFEVQPEMEAINTVGLNASANTPDPEIRSSSNDAGVQAPSSHAAQKASLEPPRSSPQNTAAATAANKVQSAPHDVEGSASIPAQKSNHNQSYAAAPHTARESSPSSARAFKSLEWAAISLDKEPATRTRKQESSVAESLPYLVEPASIDRRLMAFAVDFSAVTAGFLGFLVVFAASTPHLPTGLTAVALAGVVYAALWLLYQMLFFSFSGATAGMLYARIALCTFDDQNPTRHALRRRLGAWWLSCLPLGLGFLWCFVDEDNLSWHDRMTRTYQRSY